MILIGRFRREAAFFMPQSPAMQGFARVVTLQAKMVILHKLHYMHSK